MRNDPKNLMLHEIAQECLKVSPLVVLGSGSSVPFGLPSMSGLQQALCQAPTAPASCQNEWNKFLSRMSQSNNFETALSEFEFSDPIIDYAMSIVRNKIGRADWRAMLEIQQSDDPSPLSKLFEYLLQSNRREVQVVTTNYDRIAECAAEKVGYSHYTGFSQGYLRKFYETNTSPRETNGGVVYVWKVHGSVDWFHCCESNETVALPIGSGNPGKKWRPVIILPGKMKYKRAHDEPFRTILKKADDVIVKSKSILCVGFGFNDQHILPKLEQRCKKTDTILVVLVEKLTKQAKEFFRKCNCPSRIALEKSEKDGKSRMFSPEYLDGVDIDGDFWRLSSFMSLVQLGEQRR